MWPSLPQVLITNTPCIWVNSKARPMIIKINIKCSLRMKGGASDLYATLADQIFIHYFHEILLFFERWQKSAKFSFPRSFYYVKNWLDFYENDFLVRILDEQLSVLTFLDTLISEPLYPVKICPNFVNLACIMYLIQKKAFLSNLVYT